MESVHRPNLPSLAAALLCSVILAIPTAAAQSPTAPKLLDGAAVPGATLAYGGGDVALELTVDLGGSVIDVKPLRATPPFTDVVTAVVRSWRFEPATGKVKDRLANVPGQVLVVAVFNPPSMFAAPAPREAAKVLSPASPSLPQPGSPAVPPYPVGVVGNGTVLVEVEMSASGSPKAYRVLGRTSGFDAAALATVKRWPLTAPTGRGEADPIFVYALVVFREPVVSP
jgi:TonB family protein